MAELAGLPGAELVEEGLTDLAAGRCTPLALLVSIAASRLRRQGLPVPEPVADAELRLYRALCQGEPRGAYGRYNALMRRLDSFARALELREGQAIRAASSR